MRSNFSELDLIKVLIPLVVVLTLAAVWILQVGKGSSETVGLIGAANEPGSEYSDSAQQHDSDSAASNQNLDAELLSAAAWGQNAILQNLVSAGAKVSARAENGDTPLLLAAANGHAETVDLLLALGADVNASNKLGNTPLIEAVGAGKAQIVQTLMSKSADVGKKNIVGSTAFDLAMKTGRSDLMRILAKAGSAVIARAFDTTKPGERTPDWGQAVTQGNLQKITSLLASGADVNERGANGRTALMVAAETGDAQAVSLLLANKANPNVTDSKQGRTALMIAAEAGQAEIVQLLLNAGANPNAKDRLGETAMSNAQRLNRIQVGRVLKQAGVKTPSYSQILPPQ